MKKIILFSFVCLISFSITFASTGNEGSNEGARGQSNTKQQDGNTYVPTEGATVIYTEDFNGDNTPTGLAARNWIFLNEDNGGTSTVFSGNATVFPAFEGPTTGYAGQNYLGANGFLINQWLISPQFTVNAGDTVSFWWRGGAGTWDDSVYLKTSEGGSAIADFTNNLGRFMVPKDGWTRYTYVFNTGGTKRFAFQYYHTDGGANGTHTNYWGLDLFQVISGSVTGPGLTTNPNPANAATGVGLSVSATWTNPGGTTGNEVFFGTSAGSMQSVYNGAAKTSHQLPSLSYGTTYYWRVNASNGSGTTVGSTWSFTTMADPNNPTIFLEDFEAATFPPTGWAVETSTPPTVRWTRQTTASGYGVGTAATRMDFYLAPAASIHSLVTHTFDAQVQGVLYFDHAYCSYTDNASDRLDVETSNDGGTTWNLLITYQGGDQNPLATAPNQAARFIPTAAQWGTKSLNLPSGTNKVRFKAIAAFGNDLWLDNISVVNIIPVELTSFAATTVSKDVVLSWTTASETNNQGFQVERKSSNGEFEAIGFVAGSGTTTELQSYGFVDANLNSGSYSYRLRQIDFDGSFEYSNVIEVEVALPTVYSMEQNFPNPFNPSTTIQFSIAEASFVTLKVFNVLGEEVVTLLNNEIAQGVHEINFNASTLNSGVYFYQISAKGINGNSFNSVKKMILNK